MSNFEKKYEKDDVIAKKLYKVLNNYGRYDASKETVSGFKGEDNAHFYMCTYYTDAIESLLSIIEDLESENDLLLGK